MKRNEIFKDVLNSMTKLFVIAVIAITLIFCFSGVRFIKSGNVALILRFGKLVGNTAEEQIHEPGVLFAFPYIIDEVVTVPTGSIIEQKVETHYTPKNMTSNIRNNGYVITGDNNIAVISASLKYTIDDPVSYALKIKDIESVINACVSNAMVEVASYMPVDDILTSGKEAFTNEVLKRAQKKMNSAECGVQAKTIELTYVGMPNEVREVYEGVNAAVVEASTIIENATLYREKVIPEAQAASDKIISDANSAYSIGISDANAQLAEFWGVLEEYKVSSDVVRTRIYNKKVAEALKKIGKVKVVHDGDSNIIIS